MLKSGVSHFFYLYTNQLFHINKKRTREYIVVQRDYVRRKSRPKKNKSSFMPKFMIFMAIALIVLFSAILYFITNNKPNKPAEQPKVKTPPPAVTLPEQPQERWTYLKALETPNASSNATSNSVASERQQILDSFANNTNTRSNANQTSSTTTKWTLQCGAFKEKANADTLKAQLAMVGINGNISSGQLYRVTAGPYTSKNEADKALSSLKNSGINNCILSNK